MEIVQTQSGFVKGLLQGFVDTGSLWLIWGLPEHCLLSSVSDYIFTPCIFDSEEDLLLYVSEYFYLKNQVITMEELDDYDLRVECGDYYKSVVTIRNEKINDILGC